VTHLYISRHLAVAGRVDEAAVMLVYVGINQTTVGGERVQRRLLILPHEAAVAVCVGAKHGGRLVVQILACSSGRYLFHSRLAHIVVKASVYGLVPVRTPREPWVDPHDLGRF